MITFRYHVVSLVAVFFALAVGIIVGTGVDQSLVRTLERQYDALEANRHLIEEENDVFRAEVALWEGFGDGLLLPSLRGRLADVDVTLVLPPFTPDTFRVEIRSTLAAAGARVSGEVRLGARFTLEDQTAAEQLAIAIEAGERRGDDLLRAAGTWMGRRVGPAMLDGLQDGPLDDADLVEIEERRAGSASRHATVVAWDATLENENLGRTLVTSLLAAAAETEEPVVLAEALAQEPSVATIVRDADALRARIATVDHAGSTLGAVSLAAALADRIQDDAVRHFGVLPGADGVLPEGAFVSPSGTPAPAAAASARGASEPAGARRPS